MFYYADLSSCKSKNELIEQLEMELDSVRNDYNRSAIIKIFGDAKERIVAATDMKEAYTIADQFQQTICVFYVNDESTYLEQKIKVLKKFEDVYDAHNGLLLAIEIVDTFTYLELFGNNMTEEQIEDYFGFQSRRLDRIKESKLKK